jgi:aryl-alcohol dehydrogenase-like predicted oxidoreductase
MEYAKVKGFDCEVSRIGLGTWSIEGFMWGGTDEQQGSKRSAQRWSEE